METYYYIVFGIFTILGVLIVLDPNIPIFLGLIVKVIDIKLERWWWMLINHPNNFITTWIRNRKYDRIARELHAEMERQRTELNDNSKTVE